MLVPDQLVRETLQRGDLLLVRVYGLVKVLVLLDEGLDVVAVGVDDVGREEGLAVAHPVLGLLAVAVEEVEVEVLVELHAALDPRAFELLSGLVELLELVLDLGARVVVGVEELLAELLERVERAGARVDFRAVFL